VCCPPKPSDPFHCGHKANLGCLWSAYTLTVSHQKQAIFSPYFRGNTDSLTPPPTPGSSQGWRNSRAEGYNCCLHCHQAWEVMLEEGWNTIKSSLRNHLLLEMETRVLNVQYIHLHKSSRLEGISVATRVMQTVCSLAESTYNKTMPRSTQMCMAWGHGC